MNNKNCTPTKGYHMNYDNDAFVGNNLN